MKNPDQQSSIFWMVLSMGVIFLSSKLPFGKLAIPGAGFLPLLAGILMFLFSSSLLIHSSIKREKGDRISLARGGAKRISLIIGSLLFYGLSFEKLGFLITTFFLMGFLLLVIGKQRIAIAIVVAAISSVGAFATFQLWLNVQLPTSIWGF